MADHDDGGPAWPHHDSGDTGTRPGMSLRDWFAGQAILGRIPGHENEAILFAHRAYMLADAMIAAKREREREGRR